MSDGKTLSKWETFLDDYESKLSDARDKSNLLLNDPSATAAQKRQAVQDYARQERAYQDYLQVYTQLQTMYENQQPFPETITITPVEQHGIFYKSAVDGKYHTATYNFPSVVIDYKSGRTYNFTAVISSDEFSITAQLHTVSASGTMELTTKYRDDVWSGHDNLGFETTGYTSSASDQTMTFTSSQFHNNFNSWDNVRGEGRFIYVYGTTATLTEINYNASSGYVPMSMNNGGKFTNPTGTFPTDEPWDYYNEKIIPTVDPGTPIYPGGYEPPFNPDDPDDDPTEDPGETLPHDDGDTPPEFQDLNVVDAPSLFITQYVLSQAQLATVGSTLWSSWLDPNADVAKNFFFDYFQDTGTFNITSALDYVISLKVYPFPITLANVFFSTTDGVYMGTGHSNFAPGVTTILNNVCGMLDCGTAVVKPKIPYKDFRDMYNTTVTLYLPFCGAVELNPVEVMFRTVHVKYYIDFQSGGCTAVAFVDGDNGEYQIASKSGQIGFTLPLTATNAGQLAAQFIGDATRLVGTFGNFALDLGKAIIASQSSGMSSSSGKVPSAQKQELGQMGSGLSYSSEGMNLGQNIMNQAVDMLSRSGVGVPLLSGGSGCESMMFPDKCYIQIRRGKYVNLDALDYDHMQGWKLAETNPISSYSGFCKFVGVDTTGLTCHEDEAKEIVSLLQSGVYV